MDAVHRTSTGGTAAQAWIDEVVTRYAERVPPDAEGRLHVPSFRIELEAVRARDEIQGRG